MSDTTKAPNLTKAGALLLPRLPLGVYRVRGSEHACARNLIRQGFAVFENSGTSAARYARTKAGDAAMRGAK